VEFKYDFFKIGKTGPSRLACLTVYPVSGIRRDALRGRHYDGCALTGPSLGCKSILLVHRLAVLGFLVRQESQQPIVLNLVPRRIIFRRGYQLSVAFKVLVVDETLYCDLSKA
jgi:hypothetical protein